MPNDNISAVLAEVAPNMQDAVQTTEKSAPASNQNEGNTERSPPSDESPLDFSDEEYQNEDDPDFDPGKVRLDGRKKWPKKYKNALSEREKEINRLRAENHQYKQRMTAPQPKADPAPANNGGAAQPPQQPGFSSEQQAKLQAVVDKKPKLEDFKDYGEFIEKLTDWKADVRDTQRDLIDENRTAQRTKEAEQTQRIAQNEARILKQATELLTKYPEYKELLVENADILDTYPAHVTDAFGNANNPEVAFIELAQHPGALAALANCNPTQAAQVVAKAELLGFQRMAAQENGEDGGADAGQQEPEPKKSNAPKPLKAAKGVKGGEKDMSQMNADELDKVLGFSNF